MADVRVATALHNMGGFYRSLGDLAKAQDCYEQALEVAAIDF